MQTGSQWSEAGTMQAQSWAALSFNVRCPKGTRPEGGASPSGSCSTSALAFIPGVQRIAIRLCDGDTRQNGETIRYGSGREMRDALAAADKSIREAQMGAPVHHALPDNLEGGSTGEAERPHGAFGGVGRGFR